MSDIEHPLRDGLSSQAMEPQTSPPKASIPDAGQPFDRLSLNCDYIYDPNDWEATYSVSDVTDFLDDAFDNAMPDKVVSIGRLSIVTTKFAAKIPTVFDDDGWAEEHEVRLFDSELQAERALAKAMEAGTVKTEGLDAKHDSAGRKALPKTPENHP